MNTTENEAAAQTASLVEFSDEALRKLYSIGELQHFSSGNVMVGEGETEYSVYIVLDGQAHVTLARPKPESTEGRPWGQSLKKPSGAPLNLG